MNRAPFHRHTGDGMAQAATGLHVPDNHASLWAQSKLELHALPVWMAA